MKKLLAIFIITPGMILLLLNSHLARHSILFLVDISDHENRRAAVAKGSWVGRQGALWLICGPSQWL